MAWVSGLCFTENHFIFLLTVLPLINRSRFITGNTGKVISQSILNPFHLCMAFLSGVEAHSTLTSE